MIVNNRIMIYAFRYSMNRSSCAPSDVQEAILDNVDSFKGYELKQIIDEIKQHEELYGLGMKCDRDGWYAFIEKLETLI